MRTAVLALLLVTAAACGGSSSAANPPTAPSPPAEWTLSGSLVDNISGAPLGGATISFPNFPVITTASDGSWSLRSSVVNGGSRLAAAIDAPGYVRRETGITWNSAGRTNIRLDVIPDRAPFSLAYFRELVRNGFESTGPLEPVRRWTTAPNFYVNTLNPRTGAPLTSSEIDLALHIDVDPDGPAGRAEREPIMIVR